MIAIRSCLSIADDEESLRIHNAVWPSHAASMDEVRSWRSQLVRWAEFLVPDAGSVAVSFTPWHPDVPRVDVTVLPEQRRRGVGSALYRHASAWIAEQGVDEMDAPVGEDDRVSLDFALDAYCERL